MMKTRVLCILTSLLGNKATTQRLMESLQRMEGVEATFVLVEVEDYVRFPVPRWERLTNAWEGRYLARRKSEAVIRQDFDVLLVNGWEFVIEFQQLARRIPAAAVMDAVPATVDAQLRHRGQRGLKRWLAHRLQDAPFRSAAKHFQQFLPMGSDCADALELHYGIPRERCRITLAPQDLAMWKPGPASPSPHFRLLFVANDFERKGGEFLLQLFTRHLRESCTLTIASNDPALERHALPEGVQWLRGRNREQMLEVYHASDLFVFPTQQDYMPQVLAEALATGLPCIANDVGGIRDLVRTGETGVLMHTGDSLEQWAEQVHRLRSRPEERQALAQGARRFAEQHLNLRDFEALLAAVIGNLRPQPHQR